MLRRLWPYLKPLLALAILAAVGWQFVRILRQASVQDDLARPPGELLAAWFDQAQPVWLLASALLYLAGIGLSAVFWIALLRGLGEQPTGTGAARAYYLGHLGKYVPGKAWALLIRTTLARADGVRPAVAALTATYETLTTMASGALLAALLLAGQSTGAGSAWHALGLLALSGIPLLPGVFNRLVRRAARPFLPADAPPLPQFRLRPLLGGLALTAVGWVLLGASLWATVRAVRPDTPPGAVDLLRYTSFLAIAYVAGFVAAPAPGGLGVRELLLQQLLEPDLGPIAVMVALLLRLLWTAAEVVAAAVVYWLPTGSAATKAEHAGP